MTTRDAASTETLLAERVALHLKLSTPRKQHDEHYPTSPMGAMTLVRQAWYDARWYRDASTIYREKPALPRPERNLRSKPCCPISMASDRSSSRLPTISTSSAPTR